MVEPESGVQEAMAQEPSPAGSTASVMPVSDRLTPTPSPSPLAQQPCPTCGSNGAAMPASYVYALGRIEPRFPRLSVEKEFAQATGRAETVNLTDRQALRQVLEQNRYLVKQLCWLMTGSIPRPERVSAERFREAAAEVFDRIMQLTDNAGATDEHRALNYLTVRYPAIYAAVAQAQGRNCSLTAVDVRPSPLSGVRNIVEVIFSFTDRATDVVEKQFLRVDVTEEFPFLVTKLSPYFDR